MAFELKRGERVVWKAETDGKTWSVWPVVDDGNPRTDDELTDRTFEYRRSIGIRGVSPKTNRFDVTRTSEKAVDAWLRAHGFGFTFGDVYGK